MRWVAQAVSWPHRCAVIPFVGNSNAKKGFIDTGTDLPGWDPHVYVSVEAVEEMARMVGWQPAHVQAGHKQHATALQAQVADLKAEVDRLTGQLDAVRVLKNGGFSQANPVGRPKKVAA